MSRRRSEITNLNPLAEWMDEHGMLLEETARLLRFNQAAVARWRRGLSVPTLEQRIVIQHLTGILVESWGPVRIALGA